MALAPFQVVQTPDSRHALRVERVLAERLRQDRFTMWTAASRTSSTSSNVEAEWALAAATTANGASEPYDLGRLAWLGDAVLLLVAAIWCFAEAPGAAVSVLRSQAGGLISNRHLGAVSAVELRGLLTASPLVFRSGAPAAVAACAMCSAAGGSKKAPADVFEAVLGAILLLLGLGGAFAFLAHAPWWVAASSATATGGREQERATTGDVGACPNGDGGNGQPCAAAGSHAAALQWIGSSALRFHASAWLLSRHPELGRDGLTDARKALLARCGAAPQDCLARLRRLSSCRPPAPPAAACDGDDVAWCSSSPSTGVRNASVASTAATYSAGDPAMHTLPPAQKRTTGAGSSTAAPRTVTRGADDVGWSPSSPAREEHLNAAASSTAAPLPLEAGSGADDVGWSPSSPARREHLNAAASDPAVHASPDVDAAACGVDRGAGSVALAPEVCAAPCANDCSALELCVGAACVSMTSSGDLWAVLDDLWATLSE
eukprot:NODE_2824_length_2138_cov_7.316261.p1 GENE.NODE_2824_length_2138_cov_7.316261~~NODE_2824_length_2138_cov_7.316261.p1  ORF type:complete len:490 (+),score=112.44 NODE_2824_length_2138_cov_7.316261:480-1949(+)